MPPKLTFRTNDFRCHLYCARCDYIKDSGEQCKNRVCFGSPTCWIHTRVEYGVRTKPSTIPGAGKGLFAVRAFDADEWICPYLGQAIRQDCLELRYPGDVTAPYATELPEPQAFINFFPEDNIQLQPGERIFIDSACVRGIGSMANGKFTAAGVSRAEQQHDAVIDYREDMGELWLKARRRIIPNQEIHLYYGNEYRLDDLAYDTKRLSGNDTRPC